MVLEYRKAGLNYQTIGQRVGISAQAAHKAARAGIRRIIRSLSEAAEEVQQLELERLDTLLVVNWRRAVPVGVQCLNCGRAYPRGTECPNVLDPNTPAQRTCGGLLMAREPDHTATEKVLSIMKRRASLLGLDAPQRVEFINRETLEQHLERLEAELQRRSLGEPVPVEPHKDELGGNGRDSSSTTNS